MFYRIYIFLGEYQDDDEGRGPLGGLPIDEHIDVQPIEMNYKDFVKINSEHTETSDFHCV